MTIFSCGSVQVFLQILGVIAVSVSVIPWILIPVVPLLIFFLYLRRYFLRTSRNIKRLESTSECPTVLEVVSSAGFRENVEAKPLLVFGIFFFLFLIKVFLFRFYN